MLCGHRCCSGVMAVNAMETDDLSHITSSTLRRSNSAPNVSAAAMTDNAPVFQPLQTSRQRRFSTSQMALNVGSPASRVEQIKREESIDDMSRERLQENELISGIALSNSWGESMNLMDHDKNNETNTCSMHWRRNSFDDDSHLSMSPTRFSARPVPVRSRSLTPSPSPSPTRQTFVRRSVSPTVCLRPPSLTFKRKYRSEGFEPGVSPSKRLCDPTSSPEGSNETDSLQFDDDTSLHDDHSVPAVSQSSGPLLFGDTSRPHIGSPIFKSRFTPPRSPLARPSTSQNHSEPPRTIEASPSCFTFAPVRD